MIEGAKCVGAFQMVKMLPLSLSLLLGWTEGEGKGSSLTTSLTQTESASVFHFVHTDLVPPSVVKTQSRRQSGLVCSLLVVSLLLSPAVGEGESSDLGEAVVCILTSMQSSRVSKVVV